MYLQEVLPRTIYSRIFPQKNERKKTKENIFFIESTFFSRKNILISILFFFLNFKYI